MIIGNTQTPTNPLWRALSMVLGAVLLVGALFFGAIVLAFVVGFLFIAGSIAAARIWWIRRKLEKAGSGAQFRTTANESRRNSTGGRVIEGEFADVSDEPPTGDEHQD